MKWTKEQIKIFARTGYYQCPCPAGETANEQHRQEHPQCGACQRTMSWYNERNGKGWLCGYCYVTPFIVEDKTLQKVFIK